MHYLEKTRNRRKSVCFFKEPKGSFFMKGGEKIDSRK